MEHHLLWFNVSNMNVCLSRLSLKFLRDDSVNVGHLSNTAADFCSPVRLLHSSVGVGFLMRRGWSSAPNSNRDWMDFKSTASADWASGGYKCRSFPTAISVRESEELRRTRMRGLPLLRKASLEHNTIWWDCSEFVPRTKSEIRLWQETELRLR